MFLSTCIVLSCLFNAEPENSGNELDANARTQWRRLFDQTAADYRFARATGEDRLMLVDRATYTWARSGPDGGTYGSVYVWTHQGNAEAVACFWRYASGGGRLAVVHELHSLSPVILTAETKPAKPWTTKTGLIRKIVPDSPVPAATAVARLQQMRTFCRDFAAHSTGAAGERTELRLLPQPLYRSQSTDPQVLDGALFAFVCNIGTDPEVFLQLDARQTEDGPRWHYSLGRFSHMDLSVSYRDQEIWQALRDEDNPISRNADYTYWAFHQPFNPQMLETPRE